MANTMTSKNVDGAFARLDEPSRIYIQPMKVVYVEDEYSKRIIVASEGLGYQITIPIDEVIA